MLSFLTVTSLLSVTFAFVFALAVVEKDIYHVLTGEEELQLPNSNVNDLLQAVYYVSIYETKPNTIPNKYEIEIMTANSGEHYTCLIPIGTLEEQLQTQTQTQTQSTDTNPASTQQTTSTEDAGQNSKKDTKNQNNIVSSSIATDTDAIHTPNNNNNNLMSDTDTDTTTTTTDAPPIIEEKSFEELYQEADTLEYRNQFLFRTIQSVLQQASNNKDDQKSRRNRRQRLRKTKNKNNKNSKNQKNPNSFENAHCLAYELGYWSYDICLYEHIEQFHGKRHSPSFNLGVYSDYINVREYLMFISGNNQQDYHLYEFVRFYPESIWTKNEHFLHLLYLNGDQKRTTLVTLVCPLSVIGDYPSTTTSTSTQNEKNLQINSVLAFEEPHTHFYHFVIGLMPICGYEARLELEIRDQMSTDEVGIDDSSSSSSSSQSLLPAVNKKHAQTNLKLNSTDISVLLSSIYKAAHNDKECLILNQGWWTVEFCYGEYVRQVHYENKQMLDERSGNTIIKRAVIAEHVMGRWRSSRDGQIRNSSYRISVDERDKSRTTATIIYKHGDLCDVTSEARQTQIQFRCSLTSDVSQIMSSREDPSCEYIVQIETPLLCQHPAFKMEVQPAVEIMCYPFEESELVFNAHQMKQVADVQTEVDQILNIMRNAAQVNYEYEYEAQNGNSN